MHRFFVMRPASAADAPWAVGTELTLSPGDASHIAKVLRLKPGDSVIVCDGKAFEYKAQLIHVTPRSVNVRVTSVQPSTAEPRLALNLVQGIAKGSKMDLIVQKSVEIGVSRIIPVVTRRTVVQLNRAKADSRVERWQRIAYEAAKQAGRGRVPTVESVQMWTELWQRDDLGFAIVPWEEEGGAGLLQTVRAWGTSRNLAGIRSGVATDAEVGVQRAAVGEQPVITIVIGPEGGLTQEEIGLASQRGARPVTMGPRILRTETAAIVASALVLGAFGEMG